MARILKIVVFLFAASVWTTHPGFAAEQDRQGCKDHPLFTRMPDYYIRDCKEWQFDSSVFEVFRNGKWEKVLVEGHKYELHYWLKQGANSPGQLMVVRNHTNAIQSIDGTVLGEKRGVAIMKVAKDGKETWAKVATGSAGKMIDITIVEKQAMQQEVTADAKSMAQDIGATGKAILYGIYFDFNKSEVKPESDPTLKEIARLLSENPKLKLYVVGHTDNVGEFNYNMKLSQTRAEAVVKSLTSKYGSDGARLKPYGVSSLAPVASNRTEEGQAKNRRVELVEQ